jgi:hypothetical protein
MLARLRIAVNSGEMLVNWEALRPRGRFGVDVVQEVHAPLVGARAQDRAPPRDSRARVREERSFQLVTLVGVPGSARGRLVYELMRSVDADAQLTTWRQGTKQPECR